MKNIIKNSILIFSLLLVFTAALRADVAPEPGYERVGINLVTETKEDLSDQRFFLDFYGALHEVDIKSNGRTEIPPMGGGARYSSGKFLAIPKKNLRSFDGELNYKQLEDLSSAISKGQIEGIVELAKHQFSMEVRKGTKPPAIYYLIKREEGTLKAEKITEEKPKSKESAQSDLLTSRLSYVVSGIFITLAVLVGGIFAFRKASKKV